jgi:hypothetical protein
MKQISLSNGFVALVDDKDYDSLIKYRWHFMRARKLTYAYRAETNGGKQTNILMHRQIMDAKKGTIIDHLDGNGLNNTRSNLRFVTSSQNAQNTRKAHGKTSAYKGVSWHSSKGKWRAVIKQSGKSTHIGYFASEELAAEAYDNTARAVFGIDGTFNFPMASERQSIRPTSTV